MSELFLVCFPFPIKVVDFNLHYAFANQAMSCQKQNSYKGWPKSHNIQRYFPAFRKFHSYDFHFIEMLNCIQKLVKVKFKFFSFSIPGSQFNAIYSFGLDVWTKKNLSKLSEINNI